ncbi:MAG: FkbM family methyltransferase [Nanoarchaeota archaeon]
MNIIQIGCNDGNDHVFKFVNENSFMINKLLLIDAVSFCIDKAKETYKNFNFVEFKTLVVTSERKQTMPFFITSTSVHNYGQSSIYKNHVIQHVKNDSILEINVPNKHINEIISEFSEPIIDRLYIDAEGSDVNLILNLDLSIKPINFIQYETGHSDGVSTQGRKGEMAMEKLWNNGYDVTLIPEIDVRAIRRK